MNTAVSHNHSEAQPRSSQGNLLAWLTAAFYSLFTLLPDSHSLMVQWPWVFIWQVGWICPVLWLLSLLWQRQLQWLGNRLDWVVGLLIVGVIISAGLAPFPMQARWYSWVLFCGLTALYALSSWLAEPQRRLGLLKAQGYLCLAFIGLSLLLWISQTWLPELARLQALQNSGMTLAYDFADIKLRNWAPLGHQNYVAGYLVLALPLLAGLGLIQPGWSRWVWWGGVGLGLIDLYTTSSRGGWLAIGIVAIATVGLLLWQSALPRRWAISISLTGFGLLVALVLLNNRLRTTVIGLFSGQAQGEAAFRLITVATGWAMGQSSPLVGVGPGGVPLLYQRFRPTWAGREAEWVFQLHSTPAQLGAELGLWVGLVAVGAIALLLILSWRWLHQTPVSLSLPPILFWAIWSSLLGYGILSLFDYQLDNFSISGLLMLFLAVLIAEFRDITWLPNQPESADKDEAVLEIVDEDIEMAPGLTWEPRFRLSQQPVLLTQRLRQMKSKLLRKAALLPNPFLPLLGLGILLAGVIWLVPVHRAWQLSAQGFTALRQPDLSTFVQRLDQAHRLTPWEPYYPYQLGWNLGNASLPMPADQGNTWRQKAISWFQQGIHASPQQEFGYSNLAWLSLEKHPAQATSAFIRAIQLVPAKRGAFYGLGLSLLVQGRPNLAVSALTLEALRHPTFFTSPIWQQPHLQPLYQQVTATLEQDLSTLLQAHPDSPTLQTYLHQSRGALRWWLNDWQGAGQDFAQTGDPVSQIVLDLAMGHSVQAKLAPLLPTDGRLLPYHAGPLAIAAWLDPPNRPQLLQQAWVAVNRQLPPSAVLQQLVASMGRSSRFDQWLKQNAPVNQYRPQRAGFGVLSRHIDGPIPEDFLTVVDNIPITQFFTQLVPSPVSFLPDLDRALQPQRLTLLQRAAQPPSTAAPDS